MPLLLLSLKQVLVAGGTNGSACWGAEFCSGFWVAGRPVLGLKTLLAMKYSGLYIVRGSNVVQLVPKEPGCQWLVSRAGKAAALPGSPDRHQGAGRV